MRRSCWPVMLLLAFGLVVAACGRTSASTDFRASGAPVPVPAGGALQDASAEEFEGMLVGLRGRPVVVNVWASWCGPCRTEAPLLDRAAREHTDVTFLGVASKDERGPAREFLDEFGIEYPNVFDATGGLRRRLQLRGFPTTYVFDQEGEIVATVLGGISEQELASALQDVGS